MMRDGKVRDTFLEFASVCKLNYGEMDKGMIVSDPSFGARRDILVLTYG